MKWLAVRNWDKWQSYRQDRGQPPWIKVYRRILVDPDFSLLSDIDKCALMSIWIAAGDRNGRIPDDENMVQRICGLQHVPDLKKLQSLGWLEKPRRQRDAIVTSPRRQDDAPDKNRNRKEKTPLNPPLAAAGRRDAGVPLEAAPATPPAAKAETPEPPPAPVRSPQDKAAAIGNLRAIHGLIPASLRQHGKAPPADDIPDTVRAELEQRAPIQIPSDAEDDTHAQAASA